MDKAIYRPGDIIFIKALFHDPSIVIKENEEEEKEDDKKTDETNDDKKKPFIPHHPDYNNFELHVNFAIKDAKDKVIY